MVRFFFWCLLVVGLLASSAAAQNPFKILDILGGSQKSSDSAEESDSAEAVPLTIPANLDEEDAPPFPEAEKPQQPQKPQQPTLKAGDADAATNKAADSKPQSAAKAATGDETVGLEELPQPEMIAPANSAVPAKPEPQSVLRRDPKNSPQVVPQAAPQVAVKPASPAASQAETQSASGAAYFGASIKQAQRGRMGVEVTSVTPKSPAAAAGVRSGDVLLTFAGSPLTSTQDFTQLMEVLAPGDRIELELMRGRSKEQTLATLAARTESLAVNSQNNASKVRQASDVAPASDLSSAQESNNLVVPADERLMNQPKTAGNQSTNNQSTNNQSTNNQSTNNQPILGVVVVDGVEETRNGLRRQIRTGAAVESVNANSPAALASIPVGALIVAANGRRVETANDLAQYVKTLRAGETVELAFYVDSKLARVPIVLAAGERSSNAQSVPRIGLNVAQNQQQNVRQAADFQPVPGNSGYEVVPVFQKVERPVLKRFGQRFPLLRRVDNMIDRFEPPPAVGGIIVESPQPAIPQSRLMEERIRQQEQEIEALNRRLRDLESRRRR